MTKESSRRLRDATLPAQTNSLSAQCLLVMRLSHTAADTMASDGWGCDDVSYVETGGGCNASRNLRRVMRSGQQVASKTTEGKIESGQFHTFKMQYFKYFKYSLFILFMEELYF